MHLFVSHTDDYTPGSGPTQTRVFVKTVYFSNSPNIQHVEKMVDVGVYRKRH